MYGTSVRENREIPSSPGWPITSRAVQGTQGGTPEMYERGKSDRRVVPANPPNKATAAEVGEERRRAKGNTDSKPHPGHSAGQGASSALGRVREVARRDKDARFTALLHHVTLGRLRAAYWAISPQAAPGVDGVTWSDYGQDLEANLLDLHERVQSGRYRATPSRRVYIVRREALRRIPCSAGRNLEGGFWVCRLTRFRKVDGTRACRRAVALWRHRKGARSDPRDMAKAGLLEVQSPLGDYAHPPERCLEPVPCHALAWNVGRRNLHGAGDAQGGHSRR
jgi:hypothetical protein